MSLRWMRLLVFFDLPVVQPNDRRNYTRFRAFLLQDGYNMVQFSVYSRIIHTQESVEKHLSRLRANLPPAGSVRCMQVTEKQYASVLILVGVPTNQEKTVTNSQLLLL